MKKFEEVVPTLLSMFASENFPEQFALTFIKRTSPVPSDHWSLLNRLIMRVIGQTEDARTYKQWQSVNRQVLKGQKSFSIIAPVTKKVHNDETDEDEVSLIGFRPLPVFAYEATDGEELPDSNCKPARLPPFFDSAEVLGVKIRWKPISQSTAAVSSATTSAFSSETPSSGSIWLCIAWPSSW